MDKQFRQFYEFGPFRLEVDERRLWCDGAVVPLTPKAFDLLLALVAQPGHLLEKETLLKTLWPDSFVEENNLADNISKLRKALGEGENGQRFIETVPRALPRLPPLNHPCKRPNICDGIGGLKSC
jgi:DNA-binding winged helix-turn-helix (wHTH) protein